MEMTSSNNSRGLFDILWNGKWAIVGITTLFLLIGIYLANSTPNKYKTEVLLSPADSQSGGGLAGLASQFGGMASLAGLSLPSGESNKVGEALSLLRSRAFIQMFIEKRHLLPNLLALDSWDQEQQQLNYDPTKYDVKSQQWVRSAPKGKKVIPTPWEGYSQFVKLMEISELNKDGTLTISIESISPYLSMQWLKWLVDDLNSTVASREMQEAKQSVIYLRQQIETTQVSELKSIFYDLIEEQTKKVLLGEVRDDYVLKIIASPVFPEDRSSPNRTLLCLAMAFLGGILSMFMVLLNSFFKR
jgi:LPS O-antigen subunit length determinant protein (WzzB/FepE family)